MTTRAGVEFCYFPAEEDNVQPFKIHVGTRRSKGMDGKGDGRAFSPTSMRCHVSRVQSPETHQESLRFGDAVTGITMLNLGYCKGSMSTASSGGVSEQFPAGLRVLVVDDDPTCLMILEKMLRTCLYEVILLVNLCGSVEIRGVVSHLCYDYDLEQSGSVEEGGDRQQKQSEDADYSSSANEGTTTVILPYLQAPKCSTFCLEKHAVDIRRTILGEVLSGVSQHQSGMGNSFISPQEATYGPLSSLNGLDLQTLAAAGQIPAQSLATLQAAGLGRSTAKPRMPMPIVDQRNLFSFENPKLRFGEGQQQHLNNGKQMNLLHGIPTTMEPKQLVDLHHSAQSIGSMNMQLNAHGDQSGQSGSLLMQMSQQQSRGQVLNETTSSQVPRLPASIGQPIVTNAIASGVSARNGLAENGRGTGFNPVSQSSPTLNFPLNTTAELTASSFALGSAPGVPSLTSKGTFPEDINSEMKGPGGFIMPSYDIFSDLQHHRSHDWELQNVGMAFNGSQQSNSLQSNVDVASSVLAHQGFSSSQCNGQGRNISAVGKPIFSAGEATDHMNAQSLGQPLNTFFAENLVRVKTERVPDANLQTTLFNEQFGQEDLMSALLKQVGFSEIEFDFDGYSLDNIPV
ncbi:hypothetical protein POTOM_037179 [Populus tomentosa]|uniref:Response regulatory domain-containing protein n=1 Tax=Populus tomentosa TaxID=118781 RepID=A0A8X7YW95_POPTO|nr:hypothetical protein POTOM_037179 [Populus tomentosa]